MSTATALDKAIAELNEFVAEWTLQPDGEYHNVFDLNGSPHAVVYTAEEYNDVRARLVASIARAASMAGLAA